MQPANHKPRELPIHGPIGSPVIIAKGEVLIVNSEESRRAESPAGFAGGQGRTPQDVEDAAVAGLWGTVLWLGALLMAGIILAVRARS